MAIVVDRRYEPLLDDPDDYRPNSQIAIVFDSETPSGEFVHDLTLLFENMAPGDRIPLHTHPIEEVIVIEEESAEVTVGHERRMVGPGAVVFIPVGKRHGVRNAADRVARLHAVFPSSVIELQYIERNPAPGTEGDPPQAPLSINVQELPR